MYVFAQQSKGKVTEDKSIGKYIRSKQRGKNASIKENYNFKWECAQWHQDIQLIETQFV